MIRFRANLLIVLSQLGSLALQKNGVQSIQLRHVLSLKQVQILMAVSLALKDVLRLLFLESVRLQMEVG
jgi:hypothetical protein